MQETTLNETSTHPIDQETLTLPVDPEPVALGLVLLVILIISVVLLYIILNVIFPSAGLNLIAGIGSLILGAVAMQQMEKILKRYWRATRFVEINLKEIRFLAKGKVERQIDPRQQINVLMWHFEIQKRARAPKGWHVVALSLEQDDVYLPLYTLMSPDKFREINQSGRFTRLSRPTRTTTAAPDQRDMRVAGQQRRVQMAEAARGIDGAEMTVEHFETVLSRLESQFPRWMPATS
ncbi:MAG: hypothetical protein H7Y09_12770 [Chitinophagaceae bacterium]|nr:hypothetical protein [Anaerolineae bacterium]